MVLRLNETDAIVWMNISQNHLNTDVLNLKDYKSLYKETHISHPDPHKQPCEPQRATVLHVSEFS